MSNKRNIFSNLKLIIATLLFAMLLAPAASAASQIDDVQQAYAHLVIDFTVDEIPGSHGYEAGKLVINGPDGYKQKFFVPDDGSYTRHAIFWDDGTYTVILKECIKNPPATRTCT